MYTVDFVSMTKRVGEDPILMAKAYDLSGATKIDDLIKRDGEFIVKVVDWALLAVHNDDSDVGDYQKLVIFDADGNRYTTGSTGATETFKKLWDMCGDRVNEIEFRFYKRQSKRRDGQYMSCTIN